MKKLQTIAILFCLFGMQYSHAEMEAYSYDDVFLGYVVDRDAILTSNGKVVYITSAGDVGTDTWRLYYTTSDCTGITYLHHVKQKNSILKIKSDYYEPIGPTILIPTAATRVLPDGECTESSTSYNTPVVELQLTSEEAIPFTLPVAMPMTYKINTKVVVVPF